MKMTRMIKSALVAFLLIFSFSSFAGGNLSNLHSSKQTANTSSQKKLYSSSHYRTDVHVLNSSSELVTVKVPGTPIYDTLFPNEIEDFYSEDYFDSIEIVLYDEDGYEFFRDYVPNHATLEVCDAYGVRSESAGSKKRSKLQATIKR